jgi:hypothetical protein
MRLSEAIRLGSLLITEPEAGRADRCAIGMANAATGKRVQMSGDFRQDDAGEYANRSAFTSQWPWTQWVGIKCPICHWTCSVVHLFDRHVMEDRTMTLEQLCDLVDAVDPTPRDEPEASQPVTLNEVNQEVKA